MLVCVVDCSEERKSPKRDNFISSLKKSRCVRVSEKHEEKYIFSYISLSHDPGVMCPVISRVNVTQSVVMGL